MGGLWTVTRGAEIRKKGKKKSYGKRKNREISDWLEERRRYC